VIRDPDLDLISTRRAAARLGVCSERVRQLRREGALVGARVGDHWVYPADEVERLAQERAAARTARAAGRPSEVA
jgi:hypothetical protein